MSDLTNKTGTAMSNIENTRVVKAIKCNCKKCFHCKKDFCTYFSKIIEPKKYCKRFSPRNDYHVSKKEYKEILERKQERAKQPPAFPWEGKYDFEPRKKRKKNKKEQ